MYQKSRHKMFIYTSHQWGLKKSTHCLYLRVRSEVGRVNFLSCTSDRASDIFINNKQSLQSLVVSVYVIYGSLAVPKWPVASSNYCYSILKVERFSKSKMVQCDRDCILYNSTGPTYLSVKWGVKLITQHYK